MPIQEKVMFQRNSTRVTKERHVVELKCLGSDQRTKLLHKYTGIKAIAEKKTSNKMFISTSFRRSCSRNNIRPSSLSTAFESTLLRK